MFGRTKQFWERKKAREHRAKLNQLVDRMETLIARTDVLSDRISQHKDRLDVLKGRVDGLSDRNVEGSTEI